MLLQACNRGALRLGEAWAKSGEARRGEASARPHLRHKTCWQGHSEAHGDSKLYNTIVEVPTKAELEVVGVCAASVEFQAAAGAKERPQDKPQGLKVMEIGANQKNYRMKQSWRQASMQVLNSSVARPWKLEQNTSGQASRQALRASRLWKLEQNNMTKKGSFFGPKKKQARKMGLPSTLLLVSCFAAGFFCSNASVAFARSL